MVSQQKPLWCLALVIRAAGLPSLEKLGIGSQMVRGLLVMKVLLELLPVPQQKNGFWPLAGLPSAEQGQGATSPGFRGSLNPERPFVWSFALGISLCPGQRCKWHKAL